MALTKIGKEGITGVSNASNATFLTATSGEGVTLAGTLAVTGIHTVGTNAVATSEGGAVTTNIAQGLAKAWCNWNGQSTIAIRDSLNITTITDNGTGDTSVTIANDMADVNYAPSSIGGWAESGGGGPLSTTGKIQSNGNESAQTATSVRHAVANTSGGARDSKYASIIIHGDLA
jgi:hypothetical protein